MRMAVLPAPITAKMRPGASALTVAIPLAASTASRMPHTATPLPILIVLVFSATAAMVANRFERMSGVSATQQRVKPRRSPCCTKSRAEILPADIPNSMNALPSSQSAGYTKIRMQMEHDRRRIDGLHAAPGRCRAGPPASFFAGARRWGMASGLWRRYAGLRDAGREYIGAAEKLHWPYLFCHDNETGKPPMSGPLHGIRIIDLTSVVSGPSATMLLADQGADVIKVESLQGDFTRHVSNRRGGMAANYLNNNRNKRSVALDLKDPRGKAVLMRLIGGADVFVQNFRPGVIERMGLDEATVRSAAPDIVYVSISGFGERGPYATKPVYDPLVQALSGLTTIQAGSDEERPRLVRTILPDKLTGITAAQAITAALVARLRTGKGQHVKLSMLESVISFLWHSDMGSQTFVDGNIPQQDAQSFIDLIYETADGYITVSLMTDRQWRAAAEAMERPDWLTDPRFSNAARRQENIDARLALTQDVLRTRKTAEWLERLEAADVPCAPVLTRSDMIRHPQIIENGIVIEYEHERAGRLRQARP